MDGRADAYRSLIDDMTVSKQVLGAAGALMLVAGALGPLAAQTQDDRFPSLLQGITGSIGSFNPFGDYLEMLVSEARIKRGREILAQHKATFDAVEQAYGVDRHAIAAIWGVESNYSTAIGERPVLRSTATLACVGRRQKYFRDEFLATLEILNRGDVSPDRL